MSLTTETFDIGYQSIAGARKTNQDQLLVAHESPRLTSQQRRLAGWLYVVADGVGGTDAGDVASKTVSEQVMRRYYEAALETGTARERLERAILQANSDLLALGAQWSQDLHSTIVVALVLPPSTDRTQTEAIIANIGDSPAYLFRPNRPPRKLTVDHVEGTGAKRGLTEAMGNAEIAVAVTTVVLEWGDSLLLCSDGLVGPDEQLLDAETLGRIVGRQRAIDAAQDLVIQAQRRGSGDNITALVVRYGGARPARTGRRRWPWVIAVTVLAVILLAGVLLWPQFMPTPVDPPMPAVATITAPSAAPTRAPAPSAPALAATTPVGQPGRARVLETPTDTSVDQP